MKLVFEDMEEWGPSQETTLSFLRQKELPLHKTSFGQMYVTTIASAKTKGNHYHKKREEWLSCIQGKIKIIVENIQTKESEVFILDSSLKPKKRLHIPCLFAHAAQNIGTQTAIVLEYSSEQHDPANNDFYKYDLLNNDAFQAHEESDPIKAGGKK